MWTLSLVKLSELPARGKEEHRGDPNATGKCSILPRCP
jgi:hypothetical protein